MNCESMLVWNVRGLNAGAHWDAVRELVVAERPSLVCLQETKLSVISHFDVMQILGAGYDYTYLPAAGTRGGILVAWKASAWSVTHICPRTYSTSARVKLNCDDSEMWRTTVYGPSSEADKPAFLEELHELCVVHSGPWLLNGDFNLIYRAQDKNNNRLNRRLLGQFRRFLNEAELDEIHLSGRLYTWSNERSHPTLERIDRFFVTADWRLLFPHCDLQSLSSLCSDHAPLLLRTDTTFGYKKHFHFKSILTRFLGFLDVVRRAWNCPPKRRRPVQEAGLASAQHYQSATKLESARFVGNVRTQLEMAKEVLHQLEIARDHRRLAEHEELLRKAVKLKSLGHSSLQRTIARQELRLLWLSEGDAPTKFFHIHANARQRKKFIRSLVHQDQVVVDEDAKAQIAFDHFDALLGTPPQRTCSINFGRIGILSIDMSGLDDRFTESEIWDVIKSMHPDKAPGPDGFTARFLQVAWEIIRPDIMAALDAFWHNGRNLHSINDAILILLPKTTEATSNKDYRPISLIHCLGKLLSKALVNRLAPKLNVLVHKSQSAFIKGRSIHDNFRFVQKAARLLHARKKSRLLLKIDITKAFDSVAWPFLLELMAHMGFPPAWLDWTSMLLSSASTKISMNGAPGARICHARGLRQGDPLSRCCFYLSWRH